MATSRFETGKQGSLYTRNLASQIRVEELGDWKALSRQLQSLPKKVRKATVDAMEAYGKKYHRAVLKAIDTNGQKLPQPWAPLSLKYAKYKQAHGGDPSTMYVWQGTLRSAIQVVRSEDGLVTVGIDKDTRGSGRGGNSKLSASQIARILQSGSITHNIEARPLFPQVWKQMGGNRKLSESVVKHLDTKVKDHILNIKT